MRIAPRVIVDPAVRFGKPGIEGTRVPVALVLGKLAAGMTVETVMEDYGLTREDVLAPSPDRRRHGSVSRGVPSWAREWTRVTSETSVSEARPMM